MPKLTVECANPDEIRLRVTVEMRIVEWKQIVHAMSDAKYCAPLNEFVSAIRKGIDAIASVEAVRFSERED